MIERFSLGLQLFDKAIKEGVRQIEDRIARQMMLKSDGHRIAVLLPDHSMILAPEDGKRSLVGNFLDDPIKPEPFPWASVSFHEKHCIIIHLHALKLSNRADELFIGTADPMKEKKNRKLQEKIE